MEELSLIGSKSKEDEHGVSSELKRGIETVFFITLLSLYGTPYNFCPLSF